MSKHILLESILNDEDLDVIKEQKGVCQKCGHYTRVTDCKFGARICSTCRDFMESTRVKSNY